MSTTPGSSPNVGPNDGAPITLLAIVVDLALIGSVLSLFVFGL